MTRWRDLPHTDTRFVPRRFGSLEEWERRRAHLRKQMLWSAGLWPMPKKTALKPKIFGRIECGDYSMEKVGFQSIPGLYVCGNLYRPAQISSRSHPGILNTHGHAATGRLHDDAVASYQARCITFACLGCVAFMWDMVDYNDSVRQLTGNYENDDYSAHTSYWRQGKNFCALWNINAFGLQLWNSIRALDFLESLPEVDPKRLACTGESGGGTQTYALYTADDRLAVAAPVCMVSACMQGGCTCENAPGLRFETNNVDYGAMMAPRPLMLISVSRDWTRNTPEVELPAIKSIYELYGAGDKLRHKHFDAEHGYNKEMREEVYRWFAKWLSLPCDESFKEPQYQKACNEDLLCFIKGIPGAAIRSHEELELKRVKSARRMLAHNRPESPARLGENRRLLGEGLRLSIGLTLPVSDVAGFQRQAESMMESLPFEQGVLMHEPRGITIPIRIFRPAGASAHVRTLLVHGRGKAALSEKAGLLQELLERGQTVYTIDVFEAGDAKGEQDTKSPRGSTSYFETFNRTDAAERVYDIVLAMQYCLREKPSRGESRLLNVVGFEEAGTWVILAGAVAAGDTACTIRLRFAADAGRFDTASEKDYLDKLYIPGILRAGGLKNAAALLAPHDLLLHNTGGLFDVSWVREAYRLSPETELIILKESLPDSGLIAHLS